MRVLVATDGSAMAGVACEQAVELAAGTDGVLRIVAVVPPSDDLFGGFPQPPFTYVPSDSIAGVIAGQLRECLRRSSTGRPGRRPSQWPRSPRSIR